MLCFVVTERFAGGEDVKDYNNDSIKGDIFVTSVTVIMLLFTALASFVLLAFAVNRHQNGRTLHPPCTGSLSRAVKVQSSGTVKRAVVDGQTSESLGLLPVSSCRDQTRASKPPPTVDRMLSTRAAEWTDRRGHSSIVQGRTEPCSVLTYSPSIWTLPPPPPPPSCVVDD